MPRPCRPHARDVQPTCVASVGQPDPGQVVGAAGGGQLLGGPQAHVDAAAARVTTRPYAAQQQPGTAGRDRDPPRRAAWARAVRCWYTSATDTPGYVWRSNDTSRAAPRLVPPLAKKSSSALAGAAPSTSPHRSASHACVPANPVGAPVPASGSGQGSAARSTLPDVRVGSVSTVAIIGTSAAGSTARSRVSASAWSKAPGAVGATYPTRIWLPPRVLRTAAAAPATPGTGGHRDSVEHGAGRVRAHAGRPPNGASPQPDEACR